MKKFFGLALLFLLSALPAFGQSRFGTITASSTDCTVASSCVSLPLGSAAGGATITLTGTFSATLQFEVSGDNGTTWTAASTASSTSTGVTNISVAGYTNLRVRCSAFTSGTVNATLYSGQGSIRQAAGGSGTVTSVLGSSPIASDGNTTTPTISCPPCITSAAPITNNVVPKGSGGAQGLANSSATDNGTIFAVAEPVSSGANGGTAGAYTWNGSTSGSTTCTAATNGATVTCGNTWAAQTFNPSNVYALAGKNLFISNSPTIAAGGCGGAAASVLNVNGTAAFDVNVGTTPTSGGCTLTMPTATSGWACSVNDFTTISSTVFVQKETATGTTSVTLKNFDTTATAQAPVASDIYHIACSAH